MEINCVMTEEILFELTNNGGMAVDIQAANVIIRVKCYI